MTVLRAQCVCDCLEETQRRAVALAELLGPGDVVCLTGQLGAGKTYFTKALVAGLGGQADEVTSPTFVLMQSYEARLTVYHFDAYRLSGSREMRSIGSDETFYGQGVSVVEWADRVAEALPPERFDVHLTVTGQTRRLLRITGRGRRQAECVARLAAQGLLEAESPAN